MRCEDSTGAVAGSVQSYRVRGWEREEGFFPANPPRRGGQSRRFGGDGIARPEPPGSGVKEATREKVLAAIAELGFSRNSMASALASGKTRTVGLVVPTLRNSLFVDIAEGAQRAAKANGLIVQLASSDSDEEQQNVQLDFLDGARVSALLLAPMQNARVAIERLRRHSRPVVVLNYLSEADDVCTVVIDDGRVGYLAARHLIELGRERIAFVAGRYDLQPVVLRRTGARRAVAEAGGRVELQEITVDGLDAPDGAIAGRRSASPRAGAGPTPCWPLRTCSRWPSSAS